MIIVLRPEATEKQIRHIVDKVKKLGLKPMVSKGTERTIIGVIGKEDILRVQPLEVFPGVEKVMPVLAPYKLVSKDFKPEETIVDVGGVKIGAKKVVVIAGPCAVENHQIFLKIAKVVKKAGASLLRGGAFKPRTSPYSFQGLGEKGLKILRDVSKEVGPKNHFLRQKHTRGHLRDFRLSKVLRMKGPDGGFLPPKEAAFEEFKRLEANHQPEPLPSESIAELDRILAAAEREAKKLEQ